MTKISLYPSITLPLRATDLADVSEDTGGGSYVTKRVVFSDLVQNVSEFSGGYDNTISGLSSTSLKLAIDEVYSKSFYQGNGTLTSDRTVNQDGNLLSFTNAETYVSGIDNSGATTSLRVNNLAGQLSLNVYNDRRTYMYKGVAGSMDKIGSHNGAFAIESEASGAGLYFSRTSSSTLQYNIYVGGPQEHVYHAVSNSDFTVTRGLASGGVVTTNHLMTIANNGRASFVKDSSDPNYNGWRFFVGQSDSDSNAARAMYVKTIHTSVGSENTAGYFESNSVSANTAGHFGTRHRALGNSLDLNFGWQVIDGGTIHGLPLLPGVANPAGSYFQYIGPSGGTPGTPPANSIVVWVDTSGNLTAKGASGTVTVLAVP